MPPLAIQKKKHEVGMLGYQHLLEFKYQISSTAPEQPLMADVLKVMPDSFFWGGR